MALITSPPGTSQRTRTGRSDSARRKLEVIHAAEVAKLQRQITELEEARAGLLRATKHLTQPLELALTGEVAKRKAATAELEALKEEKIDASAAREAAAAAHREAADAVEARERSEAQAALELLRAKEFVSSHDEKVERVRQYAEVLEGMIGKVEVEKDAVEARWRQACACEIETCRLQNALELASTRHAAVEASEQARAAARRSELGVLVANVRAAEAEVKATAVVVIEKRLQASEKEARAASKHDAAQRLATETRLEALTMQYEAHSLQYDARLSVAASSEAAGLAEAGVRVR